MRSIERGDSSDERALPSRRDLLQLAAAAVAVPGASQFFSAWFGAARLRQHAGMSTAPPEPPLLLDYHPKFFDAADFEALEAFTAILIPTDDTPGAREAHCAHFIDFLLTASDAAGLPAARQWRADMRTLGDLGFHAADAAGRARLVEAMSAPERDAGATHPAYGVYRRIKQQNTFAFYTSREGMIEALDYRGNTFNASFPPCTHPEHHVV